MACEDCGHTCFLVSSECVCQFTPLKGFTQSGLSECYYAANAYLNSLLDQCDMCDGEDWSEITDLIEFKAFYSNLIYKNWMILKGAGSPSKEGFTTIEPDDTFNQFRVNTGNEVKARIQQHDSILAVYENAFLKKFKELKPTCFEAVCSCGCTETTSSDCSCGYYARERASLDIYGIKPMDNSEIVDDMGVL